jgi:hypothetical protein
MDAPPTTTSARVDAVADDGPETAPARKATMQAIVQDAYGSADVLELAAIDKPVPTDNQVLVQVQAAGLHRGDWHVMTGLPLSFEELVVMGRQAFVQKRALAKTSEGRSHQP